MTSLDAAAYIAASGLDASEFINTHDAFARDMMLQIAKRVHYRREIERHNLAVEIASQVSQLFKK